MEITDSVRDELAEKFEVSRDEIDQLCAQNHLIAVSKEQVPNLFRFLSADQTSSIRICASPYAQWRIVSGRDTLNIIRANRGKGFSAYQRLRNHFDTSYTATLFSSKKIDRLNPIQIRKRVAIPCVALGQVVAMLPELSPNFTG